MKAIKIASGVAISALAAAISAQAHAEDMAPEFSWTATGSMEAMFVYDFEGETKDVDLDQEDDFDSATAGEAWGLETTLGVVYGPFSGGFTLTADDGADVEVSAEDIVITDGAISFGQVGSLVDATPAYASDMDNSEDWDSDDNVAANSNFEFLGDLDEGADVGAAIRYTMEGLSVQLEGQDEVSDYGIAAAYAGEMDALSYVVETQFRADDTSADSAEPYYYVGAGVTYTADMFEVVAGVNQYTVPDITDATALSEEKKLPITEYGFAVTVTPMDGVSVYVEGNDGDVTSALEDLLVVGADTAYFLFGAAYTIDTITVTGEYTFTMAEETGDEVFGEVAYADGAIAAYADVTLSNFDAEEADDPQMGAGVSYTQGNGVVYAADFDFQTDVENQLKLSAAYAF